MKRLLLFLCFVPFAGYSQSHGSLAVFSEKSERFFLFLDGVQQNSSPVANIRVDKLPDLYYSARVVFADSSIPSITKNNVYVSDADESFAHVAYRLKFDRDKKRRLVFYSIRPGSESLSASRDLTVVDFRKMTPVESEILKEDTTIKISGRNLGSLHVFSSNNDKFFLYLNNVKQNDQAQSSVRINEVPGLYYNARIVFENSRLGSITKNNLSVSDGDDILMHASYRIRRDKSGKPRLNFYSIEPTQDSFTPLPGMSVYNFGNSADVIAFAPAPIEVPKEKKPVTGRITNVKISEPYAADANKAALKNDKATSKNPDKNSSSVVATKASQTKSVTEPTKPVTPAGSTPMKKCNGWPMGKGDLVAAKKLISEASKDDDKLKVAQESIKSNCVLASQVAEFCQLFSSDKTKLALAKFAFQYTLDRKNYPEVAKLFTQEKTKKDLREYINNK